VIGADSTMADGIIALLWPVSKPYTTNHVLNDLHGSMHLLCLSCRVLFLP
jgi:hypothetical protein